MAPPRTFARRSSPRSAAAAAFAAFAAAALLTSALASAASAAGKNDPAGPREPVRVREIYVPFAELEALRRAHPDGVLMRRSAYRTLLAQAALRPSAPKPAPPPPVAATVRSARYDGAIEGDAVRLTGRLEVDVAREGWVRCDLGVLPSALGHARLDGEAAWVVIDDRRRPARKTRSAYGPPGGSAHLVLRGRGRHTLELAFTLGVGRSGEWRTLIARLPRASAKAVRIVVPTRADAQARVGVLSVTETADRTELGVALGRSDRLDIRWRPRWLAGPSSALLTALHRFRVRIDPAAPRFVWQAEVAVQRQKIDALTLLVPEGVTVIEVTGPWVHAWTRTARGLVVTLNAPRQGSVPLTVRGVYRSVGETFAIAAPGLDGAYQDRTLLALDTPAGASLALGVLPAGALALDPRAAPVPRLKGGQRVPNRLFILRGAGDRLTGQLRRDALRVEVRGAYLARVVETKLALDGYLQIEVVRGRTYQASLDVPDGWDLASIVEVATPGAPHHGIRWERSVAGGGSRVEIRTARAIDAGHPLALRLRLASLRFGAARDWDRREVAFALPVLREAARARTELALALAPSLELGETAFEGWEALPPEAAPGQGLLRQLVLGPVALRLAGALRTEQATPRVGFTLVHRPARGELRAVTHVLAAAEAQGAPGENGLGLRVQADLVVAVLDRPVDRLVLTHPPLGKDVTVSVRSEDVAEVVAQNAAGRQVVRFHRPWLGTRRLRLRYRVPIRPGEPTRLPVVSALGNLLPERIVVVQSEGAVEVLAAPGAGLRAMDPDLVPSFATAWKGARVIGAYRVGAGGAGGAVGEITALVRERAPVLARLVRSIGLHTVLGADGTARTEALLLASYARAQTLAFTLPEGARGVAVDVDGVPLRGLRREGTEGRRLAIPLPPKSHAAIRILYEQPSDTEGLGRWGTVRLEAPRLDLPAVSSTWTVTAPDGYRWQAREQSTPSFLVVAWPSSWLGDAWDRAWEGWWSAELAVAVAPGAPARQAWARRGDASRRTALSKAGARGLAPRAEDAPARELRAPRPGLYPEGQVLRVEKLGGDAVVLASYLERRFARRLALAALLLGLLAPLALGVRRGRGAGARLALIATALGLLLPVALGDRSPHVAEPLVVGALLALALLLMGWLGSRWGHRRAWTVALVVAVLLPLPPIPGVLCGLFLLFASWVLGRLGRRWALRPAWGAVLVIAAAGALTAGAAPPAHAAGEPALPAPFDAVLIPFDPAGPGWQAETWDPPVFLTRDSFQRLWRIAYPKETPPDDAPPIGTRDLVVSGASYTGRLTQGDQYAVEGTIDLLVRTKEWTALPLSFDGAQVRSVRLDGRDVGLLGGRGRAALALKGRGAHRVEVTLWGAVSERRGTRTVTATLLPGAATTFAMQLGPNVEVLGGGARTVESTASSTSVRLDLGRSGRVEVSWAPREVGGHRGSRLTSASYTALRLGLAGLSVERLERVRVAGVPATTLRFLVVGDWEVQDVKGPGVLRWSVGETGSVRELRVAFRKPVMRARLEILGRARLADSVRLPALRLVGAERVDRFVGVVHGQRLRFSDRDPEGLTRATPEQVRRGLSDAVPGRAPDRLYRVAPGETPVRWEIQPQPPRVRVQARVVAAVGPKRVRLVGRATWERAEPGPLAFRIALPESMEVRRVTGAGLRRWAVETVDQTRWLAVTLRERARPGAEITWSAERGRTDAAESLGLRPVEITVGGAPVETRTRWLVAAAPSLELRARSSRRAEAEVAGAAPGWAALPPRSTVRLAYRMRRADASVELAVGAPATRVGATIVSFARLTEAHVYLAARLALRVRLGAAERVQLRLPAGAELVRLEAPNLRSREVRATPSGVLVEVVLQSKVSGLVAVDLLYRRPRQTAGAAPPLEPIEVRVGGEVSRKVDRFLALMRSARGQVVQARAEGLQAVDASQLPYRLRGLDGAALGRVFRQARPGWRLYLEEEEVESVPRFQAEVELLDLATVVMRDAQVRTRAVFTVLNRRLQFFGIALPVGASLWSVTVDGQPVAVARADGGSGGGARLRIPVERSGRSRLPLEIALTYEEPRLTRGRLWADRVLRAPRLLAGQDVRVGQTVWTVKTPDGVWVEERGGRMRPVPASHRHAERLRSLLAQEQAAVRATEGPLSRRAQARAEQALRRLEQAFSDNLAELRRTSRGRDERAQQKELGLRELNRQWVQNDELQEEAARAQTALEVRLKEQRSKRAEGDKDDRAFQRRLRLLEGSGWSGPRGAEPARARKAASAFERFGYPGWDGVALGGLSIEVERARSKALPAVAARRRDRLGALAESAPGLRPGEVQPGYSLHAYRRSGADAELHLRLTDRRQVARAGAGALLALLAVVWLLTAWWLRRRRCAEVAS